MKKFSKLMLAAIAAVSVSGTALAWDFKATGSVTAEFKMDTVKDNKDDKAMTTQKVDSEDGEISLISSNKDGDNSATFTYSLEYDDGIQESLAVEGSTKKGDWTASGTTKLKRFSAGEDGNTADLQTNNGTALVTLTNGTLTYKLGNGGHIGNAAKSEDSVASGKVDMAGEDYSFSGEDIDIGAAVGDFDGFSVGYKVNDMATVKFAYQLQQGEAILGKQKAKAEETTGGAKYDTTGIGLGAEVSAAGANIAFTYASGSTKQNLTKAQQDNATIKGRSTTMSTMGLGVDYTVAGAKIFLTYGSSSAKAKHDSSEVKNDASGTILGVKYSLDADSSVVLNISNSSEKNKTATRKMSGMELGYDTMAGPVSLGVGYGTKSINDPDKYRTDKNDNGYAATYLKVKMEYSF